MLGRTIPALLVFCLGLIACNPSSAQAPDKYSLPIAVAKDNDRYFSKTTGMEFVLIPRGTFTMGSDTHEAERYDDEQPHEVTISRDFYLGKYEVTQGEFQRVVGFNPSNFPGNERLPVEQVSWYDAVWFCNQLSKLDGRTACYRIGNVQKNNESINSATVSLVAGANGYRLPTESEWEYACRAGTTTPFSFGTNITSAQVNFDGNLPYAGGPKGAYREKTMPVDFSSPNNYGLFTMHGNVREWCWDWKANYATGPITDPVGPENGLLRVNRGGSWGLYGGDCRSAYRSNYLPEARLNDVGFRVAVDFSKEPYR